MTFEIRYPDNPNDRNLSRETAVQEIRDYSKWIDHFSIENQDGYFIAMWSTDEGYDDWITIESKTLSSREACLLFLEEVGLIHKLRN